MKKAASTKIIALGGTISHQHGVGLDHLEYLPAEKGEIGLNVIAAVLNSFDPKRLMNPGKLIK
jgi:alkyldihydroxyacetonephosphate synthase